MAGYYSPLPFNHNSSFIYFMYWGGVHRFHLKEQFYCVLVPVTAVTNCHKLGDLKQQKFIPLYFWRPEVRNQGDGWDMLSLGSWGGSFLVSSWLLVVAGIPWHSWDYSYFTPISALIITWPSFYISQV